MKTFMGGVQDKPSLSFSDKAYLNFRLCAKHNMFARKLFLFAVKHLRRGLNKHIQNQSEEAIKIFVPSEKQKDSVYLNQLRKKFMEMGFIYSINPSEYFLLDYERLNESERAEFVGDYEKNWLCQRIDRNIEWNILNDKKECFKRFKSFFKREAIELNSINDKELFFDFVVKHNGAIIKEAFSAMGKHVQIVHSDLGELTLLWDKISLSFAKGNTYIVEELIHQSNEMAMFHPESVNTVRMMTFKNKNEVVLLGSFVRFGRGQSIVDNAGSGGIFAEVDTNTGKVIGSAITESGEKFDVHPDSGVSISGFQIPKWDELVEFSIRLANELKVKKYVGWDCALTDQGWVMVEGNSHGQFVNQYPNKNGMRDRVRKYFYPVLGIKKDY